MTVFLNLYSSPVLLGTARTPLICVFFTFLSLISLSYLYIVPCTLLWALIFHYRKWLRINTYQWLSKDFKLLRQELCGE